MHEFDSFVRRDIRPLAYVRYGDDFILFCRAARDVERARSSCVEKLRQLGLKINETQDRMVRSWQGLHFLGHVVHKDGSVICRKTKNLMLGRVNLRNMASYSSLKIDKDTKRLLPWLVDL